ncbi:MAG TPA: hypothetical protein EYP71_03725 [Dehalococcoidia bacterium]|nr:hypothetical protein [Dehalococcoidia bacterium]
MNRGCIAIGEIKCDGCQRLIEHGQRYLLMEGDGGEKFRFCVDCCLSKGHAAYVKEKGEQVLTFFPTRVNSQAEQQGSNREGKIG